MTFDYAVNKTVLKRLLCGHKIVSFGIPLDLLDGSSGALGKNTVKRVTCAQKKIRTDLNIAALTLCPMADGS